MNVKVSAPGKPDLIRTVKEVEALMRTAIDDNKVDLVLLALETKGTAGFTHKGVTVTLTKIVE